MKKRGRKYSHRVLERLCVRCAAWVTLTLKKSLGTKILHRRFASWWKKLKKLMPGAQYAMFPEIQQERYKRTGEAVLHLNVLVLGWRYVHRSRLIKEWKKRTGAWDVDVRRIDGKLKAVRYITKYLTKEMAGRVSFSRMFSVWSCDHLGDRPAEKPYKSRFAGLPLARNEEAGGIPALYVAPDAWFFLGPRPIGADG